MTLFVRAVQLFAQTLMETSLKSDKAINVTQNEQYHMKLQVGGSVCGNWTCLATGK